MKHEEEVLDYAIDNRVSLKEAYLNIIDERLKAVEDDLTDFKNEVHDTHYKARNKQK